MDKVKVLFVCTGNTCRSPMAAALAADAWTKAGILAEVSSAGLYPGADSTASAHSLAVMSEHGLDISSHRAQPVGNELISSMDLVLTMTAGHRDSLVRMFPDECGRIHTLAGFSGGAADVGDPFGMDRNAYRACAGQIRDMVVKCTEKIKGSFLMEKTNNCKLHITNHPLVQSKITMLRSIETGNKEFRELVGEIATLICYEATHDIELQDYRVETPVGVADGKVCCQKFGIVPILRAGLGMVEGILRLLPTAKVGHIGLYRDPESLEPVEYYCKLPQDSEEREIFLLDPMLATGGTAAAAIGYLKTRGVKRIRFLCLLAVAEGVKKIHDEHPDVDIYTAAYDKELNDHGYIIPGLGDAGDRLFGTK